MSRLWTEWRSRLSRPFRHGGRELPRIGIALGRRRIDTACVLSEEAGWREDWQRSVPLTSMLFEGVPAPTQQAALAEHWAQLLPEATRDYVPVHVALPDAALQFAIFDVEVLPKPPAAQQELVSWLFAREHQLDSSQFEFSWKALGTVGERQRLLAIAAPRAWIVLLRQSLKDAGIVVWSMDAMLRYRFNHAATQLADSELPAAVLAIEHEYWTLLIVDAGRRPALVRSRWREATDPADAAGIADETENLLRLYVTGQHDRQLARVAITGASPDATQVAQCLDSRLGAPVLRLSAAVDPEGSGLENAAHVVGVAT